MLEVDPPDMDNPQGDLEQVFHALGTGWNLSCREADLHVIQDLQAILAEGNREITCALYQAAQNTSYRLSAVWPGFHDQAFGVAVDVGSTTIACHLCDLRSGEVVASAGMINPQIRFGEDLMSRVLLCRNESRWRSGDDEGGAQGHRRTCQ